MKTRPPKSRPPKTPKKTGSGAKTGTAPGHRTLALLLASGRIRLSQPGDPQEKEADRIADAVTSPPAPAPEEERSDLPSIPASPTLSGVGPGRPLDPEARAMLESRFGRDLGAVRVHEGAEAAEAAQAAEARAFTVGRDVIFSPGQYAPGTPEGRRLLAHELAHVVQQSEPGSPPGVQRSPWDVEPPQSQPTAPAAAPEKAAPAPTILEIGSAEPISSQNPKLAEFAKTVLAALTPTSSISIIGFWDANTAITKGGFQRGDADQRAKLAESALSALGIPAQSLKAGAVDRNLLSKPEGAPAGLVRITFYPLGLRLFPPGLGSILRLPPPPPPWLPQTRPPLSQPPSSPPPSTSTLPGVPPKEARPRKGEPGDVAKAVLALPPVQKALEKAKEKALKDFKALPPEGKVGLITGAVAIVGGAAAGLAAHPDVAKDLLEKADGLEIPLPLPGVPGEFKVQILNKPELPKFDPHAPTVPEKPSQPAGQGALLKWEIRF